MPVVSREEVRFPDKDGNYNHLTCRRKIPVKYSSKNEHFSMEIPEHLQVVNGNRKEIKSSSLEGIREGFKEICQEYKDSLTSKVRLLAYNFTAIGYIFDNEGDKCIHGDSGHAGRGLNIKFDYKVVDKYTVGKKTYYKWIHKVSGEVWETSIGWADDFSASQWKFIDWTEQREKFFQQVNAGFLNFVFKLEKFFEKEKDFLKIVDSGKNFKLLGEGNVRK